MTQRKSLLVGSMPFANEEAAMQHALNELGDTLISLPDGEIGEVSEAYPKGKRAAWVMSAIDICSADTANWELSQAQGQLVDGFPADYADVQKLKPKHPPSEMHHYLNFSYHDYFQSSYPIFKKLRESHHQPDLKFQVGVPTGLGITISMMNPINALRYVDAFNKRIAYEVNEILKMGGDDVIIQIEVPAELKLAYTLPDFLMPLALRSINGLVEKIDSPAQMGIHICLGDLNNIALTQAKTLNKMVKFSNLMVKNWSKQHPLLYVHYPLAEAASPPPTNKDYYLPLRDIDLPAGVRFVAGFVHEKNSPEDNQRILETIESVRGSSVDIACSCGLGRRSAEIAEKLITDMHHVVQV